MVLPKKIRFWLFKLKARNLNQKIKDLSLISVFWLSVVAAVVIWAVFDKLNEKPVVITLPEPVNSIQVSLFTDENLIKDLPKQINTKADLDSLIKASRDSDLNIDSDLNQINY